MCADTKQTKQRFLAAGGALLVGLLCWALLRVQPEEADRTGVREYDKAMTGTPDGRRPSESLPSDDEPAPAGVPAKVVAPSATAPLDPEPAAAMRPPGGTLRAPTADDVVREEAARILQSSGPASAEQILGLLRATQPGVGLVGAALAAVAAGVPQEVFDALAQHPDVAVPLFAMQALGEQGRLEGSSLLRSLLLKRMAQSSDWTAWVEDQPLPGTAVRGLLDLAQAQLDPEQREALAEAIVNNPEVDYAGRMRALLEFEELLPFGEFRALVSEEQEKAATRDADVWQTGLDRLIERLEGPPGAHPGPDVLTAKDVEVMLSRPYPAMYEDLALRVESAVAGADPRIAVGVSDLLRNALSQARLEPLSTGEASALDRMEWMLDRMIESDVSGLVPPRPPM